MEVDNKNTFIFGIEQSAKVNAEKIAFIYGEKEIKWKELDGRTNALAHAFLDIGLKREDRIAVALYNSNQFTESICAGWKIASVTLPLNYRFVETELLHVIDLSDTTIIVLHSDFADRFDRLRPNLKKVKHYIVLGEEVPDWALDYDALIDEYPKTKPDLEWKPQSDDDIGYNIHTGGTTGYPKIVSYREKNFIDTLSEAMFGSTSGMVKAMNDAPEEMFETLNAFIPGVSRLIKRPVDEGQMERFFPLLMNADPKMTAGLMGGRFRAGFVSPFMHAWAYAIHLSILRSGGTVVPAGTSFNAEDALEMIESKRVNFLTAIGDANLRPMVDALERKKYDMQSLFGIIASGMYTSPDVKRRLFEQIPHLLLLDVFISSEISHGAFRIYTAADKELQKATFKTTDSIKVLDPETCEPVKPGETGEVARRTESLPEGYYKDKEKTNELIREINGEHWLFSGDMAMLDKDGYFHFVGRGSECINTGGEKVYPEEVEEVIKRHSKVENAGVTGVPDEKWGEAVTAIVQLKKGEKAGESEIIDFCRDRMAGYKKPKHVIFVEELPTTTIGKAWYKELRKLVEE